MVSLGFSTVRYQPKKKVATFILAEFCCASCGDQRCLIEFVIKPVQPVPVRTESLDITQIGILQALYGCPLTGKRVKGEI